MELNLNVNPDLGADPSENREKSAPVPEVLPYGGKMARGLGSFAAELELYTIKVSETRTAIASLSQLPPWLQNGFISTTKAA